MGLAFVSINPWHPRQRRAKPGTSRVSRQGKPGMSIGKLTDIAIRSAKARATAYKLTDGGGLHLYITPAGAKLWRLRYERNGKEQLLSLGKYPDVTLAEARDKRGDSKKVLRAGGDPAVEIRRAAAGAEGETFETIARAWHKANLPRWSPKHGADVLATLKKDIFPALGAEPLNSITPPMVLEALREIEERGAVETAHRVRQRMSDVFAYAIAAGIGTGDPAAIVKKALSYVHKRRQPAVTKLEDARKVLVAVEAIPGYPVTKLAMRLLAITVLRPGAFRVALWSDFAAVDWEKEPTWVVPAERMKLKKEHKEDEAREFWVPLPTQAKPILEALKKLTGTSDYLFPNLRGFDRPMSENALGYMLNRAGYQGRHVPHGWRAAFSTIMNERYPDDRAVIDLMLAHTPKDKVQAAYNRALYMTRRRELAQIWADLILAELPPPMQLLTGRRK